MNEGRQQPPEAESSGPLGGERLAAARRAHAISATDIAKELHLDERKIRALENNDFAILGAPVFAKGHLKKYAELVGVPVDDILADYYELNRSAGAPPVVGPVRKIRRDISWGPWISGTIIIVMILGAVYWFFTRGPSFSLTEASAVLASTVPVARRVQESRKPADAAVTMPEPESSPEQGDTIPQSATASVAPAAGERDSVAEAASLLPQVNVELAYSGDCWTEVTDASGHRLFYELGSEGRVVTLAGDEPLQIVLGASDNVSIAVDGRDYPVPDSARRGRMARLTIHSR